MVESIPAILRVGFVFAILLIGIRKKLSFGNAFLLGAIVLGVVFGLTPAAIIRSIIASITHPKTLSLAIVVSLILLLSHSLEQAGQMQRLLESFQGLVKSPRLNVVAFPALIGLLPMPGGAIFSAPMVKNLGAPLSLSASQLSYINYWYRHIWEYWWPLYPGVLLTTTLAEIDLWVFVLALFPVTIVAFYSGWWPLRGAGLGSGHSRNSSVEQPRPPLGPFLKELAPILIAICLGVALGAVLSTVAPFKVLFAKTAKEVGLIISLCLSIGWVWYGNRMSAARRLRLLKNRQLLLMIYMVASILAFKGILGDSHAVQAITDELMAVHIPLLAITVVLPFLVGLIVGITVGYVGTTFPILIAIIQAFGESHFILSYMMLGLVSGFVGVLVSPLHICLLLSNEYFGTGLGKVYRYLLVPCLVLLFAGMLYFLVLQWLNPF